MLLPLDRLKAVQSSFSILPHCDKYKPSKPHLNTLLLYKADISPQLQICYASATFDLCDSLLENLQFHRVEPFYTTVLLSFIQLRIYLKEHFSAAEPRVIYSSLISHSPQSNAFTRRRWAHRRPGTCSSSPSPWKLLAHELSIEQSRQLFHLLVITPVLHSDAQNDLKTKWEMQKGQKKDQTDQQTMENSNGAVATFGLWKGLRDPDCHMLTVSHIPPRQLSACRDGHHAEGCVTAETPSTSHWVQPHQPGHQHHCCHKIQLQCELNLRLQASVLKSAVFSDLCKLWLSPRRYLSACCNQSAELPGRHRSDISLHSPQPLPAPSRACEIQMLSHLHVLFNQPQMLRLIEQRFAQISVMSVFIIQEEHHAKIHPCIGTHAQQ